MLSPSDLSNTFAFKSEEIHPAIQYFQNLQMSPPSKQLEKFLANFVEPKSIEPEIFVAGVKKFIELANLPPDKKRLGYSRKALYGDIYSGIHYNNDLVKLWNAKHSGYAHIKASQIATLAPLEWDSILQNGSFILIYKGQQPALALDNLVKGPTVIDCGMFTQLSLWFGIRYMLGNERFNQCFGRAPFFITQSVYSRIEDSSKPYSGNPLHSFLSKKEKRNISSVTVKHITNTLLYRLKHPGGNYGGENCLVIDEQYYIFDPQLENTQGISEKAVLNLLREVFNQERAFYDDDRLSLYAQTPTTVHPIFLQTYAQLIERAEELKDWTLSEEEFSHIEQDPNLELTFDLQKFSIWLQRLEKKNQFSSDITGYLPQPIDNSLMPYELLNVIPFENKTLMEFSKFKQDTPQQKELMTISMQFCQSMLANESQLVILSGKAGIGKTASAVCAAKELTARGKKVVWISEVMVKGWAEQAKSISELDNCALKIDNLLATNPDVIFLDDDNLAGFSGNLLLEKIYTWYVSHPGKGLFITSNESICFKECWGYKLDKKYYYPPFNHYDSTQYLNWQHKKDLAGESLRLKRDGQSIGAIVSDSTWKAQERYLTDVELIPAFNEEKELAPIRNSLRESSSLECSAYHNLRPIQQQWLSVNKAGGCYSFSERGSYYIKPYLTVNPSKFEETTSKTIALEINDTSGIFSSKKVKVDSNAMAQLIRVLNYAHDQGGRRVILINQTSFSAEELLFQIKQKLPESERERTWSRLMLLLCETEDSIFKYEQFNGRIENATSKSSIVDENSKALNCLTISGKNSSSFFTGEMDEVFIEDTNENTTDIQKEIDLAPIFFTMLGKLNNLFNSKERKQDKSEESQTRVEKYSDIPKRIFTEFLYKHDEKEFLIKHRHEHAKLQHEYDKQFGMILRI